MDKTKKFEIVQKLDKICCEENIHIVAILDDDYEKNRVNPLAHDIVYYTYKINSLYEIKALIAALTQTRFYSHEKVVIEVDKKGNSIKFMFGEEKSEAKDEES